MPVEASQVRASPGLRSEEGAHHTIPTVITVVLVLVIPFGSGLTSLLDLSSAASLILASGLMALVLWVVLSRKKRFLPPKAGSHLPEFLFLLMGAWAGVSILWSGNQSHTFHSMQPIALASVFTLFFAGVGVPDSHRRALLKAWVLLATAMSIHAVVQFFGLEPLYDSGFLGIRGSSILPHPNVLGGHLAITLPMVGLAYPGDGSREQGLRYGLSSTLVLGTIATLSRAALLAVAVSMLLLWWLGRRGRPSGAPVRKVRGRIAPAVFAAGCGLALFLMVWWSVDSEHERFLSFLGISGLTRLGLWSSAGTMFLEAPLLGHGYGMYPLLAPAYRPDGLAELYPGGNIFFKTAHLEYLQQLSEVGLIGLVLMVGFLISLFRRLIRGLRTGESEQATRLPARILVALIALALFSLLHSTLRFPILLFDLALLVVLSGALVGTGEAAHLKPNAATRARWKEVSGAALLVMALFFSVHASGTRALSTALYQSGHESLHGNEQNSADNELHKALEVHPENIEARYLYASLRFSQADYASAYREYFKVWTRAPYFTNVLYNLGVSALRMEHPDLARSWLSRSRALNPYREETLTALELFDETRLEDEQE